MTEARVKLVTAPYDMQKIRASVVTINIVFLILTMVSCGTNRGSFLLINKADQPILRASVMVCGQTIELNDIQPTQSAQGFYKVRSDSHFDIIVEFQSGEKLQRKIGYVTNGFDFQHEMVVTDTDIEITSSRSLKK
jgi:hypothetical protein